MLKFLLLLPIICGTGLSFAAEPGFVTINYREQLVYELVNNTYKVVGVKSDSLTNTYLRVYGSYNELPVTEIASDAFNNCTNLNSIMISKDIVTVPETVFSNEQITTFEYTGSKEAFISTFHKENLNVVDYACDEGFINYWNDYVRKTKDTSICDIGKDGFTKLDAKYKALTLQDKEVVDNTVDLADSKIGDSMKYLEAYFKDAPAKPKGTKIGRSLMLTFIIVIAVFGMTSITVFYLLKKKNIIG